MKDETNEVDLRVTAEIASIQTNAKGERLVTDKILGETAIETCLVLLLDHAAHHVPIADPRMVKVLTADHYSDIHPTKGGLSWETYVQYARGCPSLLEAAERHRVFISRLKK